MIVFFEFMVSTETAVWRLCQLAGKRMCQLAGKRMCQKTSKKIEEKGIVCCHIIILNEDC